MKITKEHLSISFQFVLISGKEQTYTESLPPKPKAVDMSEFSKAKVKRENFVSHNDKAIDIVEELTRSKDRIKEYLDKITAALGEIEDTEKKDSFLNSFFQIKSVRATGVPSTRGSMLSLPER